MARKKRSTQPSIDDFVDTESGRFETLWREVRRPLLWTGIAFGAIALVVFAGTSRRGEERLATLPAAIGSLLGQSEPSSAVQLARLEAEIARLRDETRYGGSQQLAAVEQRLADL